MRSASLIARLPRSAPIATRTQAATSRSAILADHLSPGRHLAVATIADGLSMSARLPPYSQMLSVRFGEPIAMLPLPWAVAGGADRHEARLAGCGQRRIGFPARTGEHVVGDLVDALLPSAAPSGGIAPSRPLSIVVSTGLGLNRRGASRCRSDSGNPWRRAHPNRGRRAVVRRTRCDPVRAPCDRFAVPRSGCRGKLREHGLELAVVRRPARRRALSAEVQPSTPAIAPRPG